MIMPYHIWPPKEPDGWRDPSTKHYEGDFTLGTDGKMESVWHDGKWVPIAYFDNPMAVQCGQINADGSLTPNAAAVSKASKAPWKIVELP